MKTYKCKAVISILLVILMAFLLPVQVFAQTLPEPETPESVSFGSMNEVTTANIVTEIEDKRDETTKHFRMDDGTIMAVSYGSPVHYKNSNGKWVEYDNSLIADEPALNEATADEAVCSYVNKKSNIDIEVAHNSINEKMINIGAKKGNISWKYSGAKYSNAKVKNNNKKYKGNEKFTNVDKMTSTAQYDNIYEKVDLECIVSPSGVKENLILESAEAQNEFEIVYNIKGLTSKQIDEKTIKLYNENGKKAYTISAPCMYDAEKNYSEDLTLEILENKNNKLTVKLVADKSFLNSWGRQYPVTIDPEVVVEGQSGIMTAQVCKNTPGVPGYQGTHFYVGSMNGKEYSGLIKSDGIEDDYADKNIVSAKVKIYGIGGTNEMEINAYPITASTSSWTYRTATYNMLTLGNDVIDYETLEFGGTDPAVFDITKTFKQWCSGEIENNGIFLESDDSFTDFAGYAYYYDGFLPRIEVIYKEYNGSESHLTSHSVSCGYNAQMSVVDYTGDMVLKQELYSEGGTRFPMNIYATYHSADNYDDHNFGNGWRMSFDKTLTLSNGYYVYEDSDGVRHYFKTEENAEKLYDEDDNGYTLTISDNTVTIEDGAVIYSFDAVSEGATSKIKSETDVDKSANTITYTYNDAGLLTRIQSIFGRYDLYYANCNYNESGKVLSCINLPDSSQIVFVYYQTSSNTNTNKLSRVRLSNNQSTFFTYSSDEDNLLLTEVRHKGTDDNFTYMVRCDYNANNQVTRFTEYGYNGGYTAANYLRMSYSTDNTTTFTDKENRSETYTFDEHGNTISVLNANGYIENTGNSGLSNSGGSDSYTKNYVENSNDPEAIGTYFHRNDESTSTGGSVTVDETTSYLGSKSIKISHTSAEQFYTTAYHQFNVTDFAEETITLSAYVKLADIVKVEDSTPYGAVLRIESFDADGNSLEDVSSVVLSKVITGAQWQRISVTADISEATTIKIHLGLKNAQGTAWFDCLQLEDGSVMNDYNALSNSDFTTTDNWYKEDTSSVALNSNGDVEIQGIGGEPAQVEETTESEDSETTEQTVSTYTSEVTETEECGYIEETDSFGNVTKTMQGFVTRTYDRVYEVTEATESSSETDEESDSTETTGDEEIVANKYIYQTVDVNKANVSFNISGTANAKSVPLSNEYRTFGIALKIKYVDDTDFTEEHYQEFNCATTINQSVCAQIYPYEDNKIIESVAFAFVYGYNKNVMTVSNAMLNFAYNYNAGTNDNVSSNTSTDDDDEYTEDNYIDETLKSESLTTDDADKKYMQSSTTYDSTGSFISSQTDEAGNTVSYTYDASGNQTSITDGKGNTTSYGYDTNRNLTSITSGNASNTYTYDSYARLSAINHNGFAYNFNYGVYDQLVSTKVGDQTLVSNTYLDGNGLLQSSTYGNGDVIAYSYDSYDRIVAISNGTDNIVEYTYNKKGLITEAYDCELEQTTYYDYDCFGNMTAKIVKGQNNELTYYTTSDADGNSLEFTDVRGNHITVVSGVDDNGNSYVSNQGITVTNEVDDFGRQASVSVKFDNGTDADTDDYTPITSAYDYASGSADNSTTNLVEKITHTYGENESVYQYEYDENGNIVSIKIPNEETEVEDDTKTLYYYRYDSLNQLISVNDYLQYKYTTFTYDNAGNILSRSEVALDEVRGYPVGETVTNTYSYDENWKDKLTSYNNETINYDEIGNPINYRNGMVFDWENGRQLKSVTKDSVITTYTYNSDGMRTQKSVSDGNTKYYYDGNNNLIASWFDNNTPNITVDDVTLYFFYDANGSPVACQYGSGARYYYVKNLQGDVEKIVTDQGEVIVSYTYDAWGNILSQTDYSIFNLATRNPFRYRGYVYDVETGFYYLQSRYYDPRISRFLNADIYTDTVTGSPLSTNMFAYCANNVVNKKDRSGTDPTDINVVRYNCYAYAMGYNDRWLHPGKGTENAVYFAKTEYGWIRSVKDNSYLMPEQYSVNKLREWVIDDFGSKIVRKINSRKAKLKSGEYRIAMRIYKFGGKVLDFHFWKQDPKTGKWYHKTGQSQISVLGKVNPDNSKKWGKYNSKTLYLAVKRKFT